MDSLIQRLRWVRREALGLNRRNQQFMIRLNPPQLVGLVDHKIRTKEVLARHGLPVPETFGRYTRQRDLVQFERDIGQRADFVLKPARGAGGEGVVVIAGRRDNHLVGASGALVRRRDLIAHAADIIAGAFSLSQSRDEALLEHRLVPDPILSAYSPGGIPDVRVIVAFGVPLMAMLRLPTRGSDGRANLHVGGIGVGIALATGRAVHAIWRERAIRVHPDTHQPLPALIIPQWADVLHIAARSYEAIPLGYFGIDIVIDAHLGPTILELNARPGLGIQLANQHGLRPLLRAAQQRGAHTGSAVERVAAGIEITRLGSAE